MKEGLSVFLVVVHVNYLDSSSSSSLSSTYIIEQTLPKRYSMKYSIIQESY